jgi:hypothetical protein
MGSWFRVQNARTHEERKPVPGVKVVIRKIDGNVETTK